MSSCSRTVLPITPCPCGPVSHISISHIPVSMCYPCMSLSSCLLVSTCLDVPVSHIPVSPCSCLLMSPCPCLPMSACPCLSSLCSHVPVSPSTYPRALRHKSLSHVPVFPHPHVPMSLSFMSLCSHVPVPRVSMSPCPRLPVSLSPCVPRSRVPSPRPHVHHYMTTRRRCSPRGAGLAGTMGGASRYREEGGGAKGGPVWGRVWGVSVW